MRKMIEWGETLGYNDFFLQWGGGDLSCVEGLRPTWETINSHPPQLHHLDICPVVLCYCVRGQRSFWGLSLHELAVSWALYLVSAETLGLVYLIVRIASLEEEDLPVALECEDVCADAVEEPTVV